MVGVFAIGKEEDRNNCACFWPSEGGGERLDLWDLA